jgi:hypothetical protein
MKFRIALFSLLVACVQLCVGAAPEESSTRKVVLSDRWSIQPSTEVQERGDVLSTVQFQPKHWYAATVPSTVVAALVADHVYADPYFGMNLRSISGTVIRSARISRMCQCRPAAPSDRRAGSGHNFRPPLAGCWIQSPASGFPSPETNWP